MPKLSQRGTDAPSSPIRRLTPFADAVKDRGIHVHHLNIGQPDIETPRVMLDAYRAYDEKVVAYAPSEGFRDYRQRLAEYCTGVSREGDGAPVTADQILVTVGGSEAILFAVAAICDPGDDIVVCEPYYTNYAGFGHLLSVGVTPVTTRADDGFRIHPDAVERAIGPRSRALVLPSPGNPTGVVLSRAELAALAEICKRKNIFFICDEVYREFVYDAPPGSRAPSILSLPDFDEHGVVIDSVSKRYSACGARVGCIVTRNPELRAAALKFAQARLSPATVDQRAAMAALDTPPEYFVRVITEYKSRRDRLVRALSDIGVDCATPQGAFYLVAPLPVDDADRFCRYLLEDFSHEGETVMLAPASGFYATPGLGANEVRIAYVLDGERLERSVHILGRALEAFASQR
jgi:aspartate aminotransferase